MTRTPAKKEQEKPPRQYVTIFKRLAKLTIAASKTEGAVIENLLLTRKRGRTRLLATDGLCAVAVSHAGDSLLDNGSSLVVPADLVRGIAKANGGRDDLVELVEATHNGQPVVEACMPSGITLQMAPPLAGRYPDIEALIKPPKKADCVVEISAPTLRTALKAILASCPEVNTIKILAIRDKPLLWITGNDGKATFAAVLAGATLKLVETPEVTDPESGEVVGADMTTDP